jgi:hypothetical protein
VKRAAAAAAIALAVGVAAWQGVEALQVEENVAPALPLANSAAPADATTPAPAAKKKAAPATPAATDLSRSETPMAERVAVIGLLNKRNGTERDLTMRPGQAIRVGDVVVRLRACETTGDWEPEPLTGAFVQMDVQGRDSRWRRVFSGWLYKETPSLNVVEHPVYDVWPKSCAMTHPDIGAGTLTAAQVGGGAAAAVRSKAKKSPEASPASTAPAAATAATAEPSASSSNSL